MSVHDKVLSTPLRPIYKYSTEDKITELELRGFMGLLILFGAAGKNDVEISTIWSQTTTLHHLDVATATMARERFQFISKYICFYDGAFVDPLDRKKYYKIEEPFEHFRSKLRKGAYYLLSVFNNLIF